MNVAIVFAGGTGQHMRDAARSKQFLGLYGKPIIIYTLEIFQSYPDIDVIIVPCVDGWHDHLCDMARKFGTTKLLKIVPGGRTSRESKLSALRTLKDICSDRDIILMHDAVRPLTTPQVVSDNIASVKTFGSTITVDPLIEIGTTSSDGKVVGTTIERQRLYIAKALQSFCYCDVLTAHKAAVDMPDLMMIDTCTIMTTLGKQLHSVPYDRCNTKITAPGDYYIFKTIYDLRESQDVSGI